jgi:sugar lactone lactonase YvrE
MTYIISLFSDYLSSAAPTNETFLCPTPGQCWYCTQCEGCCACAAGNYCPGNDQQISCPAGTYNPSASALSGTACLACPAGTASSLPGASACVSCMVGHYSNSGATSCSPCPAGTYSTVSGGTSLSNCSSCPTGTTSLAGSRSCSSIISTVAGLTGSKTYSYGTSRLAGEIGLYSPAGVTVDSVGNIYFTDKNQVLRVTRKTGTLTCVVGFEYQPLVYTYMLNNPTALAFDSSGNLYVADTDNSLIQMVTFSSTPSMSVVAGASLCGTNPVCRGCYCPTFPYSITYAGYWADDVRADITWLNQPHGLALDKSNNLYIADTGNNRIRRVDAVTRMISTLQIGAAMSVTFNSPYAVAVDSRHNLYVVSMINSTIIRVDASTSGVTTIDGSVSFPRGVAVDKYDNVYVADTDNNRIKVFNVTKGAVSVLTGNGLSGYRGDGGPASAAELSGPQAVVVDTSGNVYIADTMNARIRAISGTHTSRCIYSIQYSNLIIFISNIHPYIPDI